MPLVKKIKSEAGVIGIWELTEPVNKLFIDTILSDAETEQFNKFKVERRKKEYLATRLLLTALLKTKAEIQYTERGKPFLKNKTTNISISHSNDFVTVFLSEKKIGIDVEQTNRNIDKISTRFLHKKELEFISGLPNPQDAKILFWSAKEAIFKCSYSHSIQFNEQIFIFPFEPRTSGEFSGTLQTKGNKTDYRLNYLFIKNNVVVYCVEL
ncbi:MAG: 4'-phosphopantetheinyl transferase superfamily protein [Bacteroidota bacterium]